MKLAGQNVEVNDSSKSVLLSGIDMDAQAMDTQPMDNSQSIRDFPGGTISFLFEKCSKAELDGIVDK
jgi:DNA repair and recombination protein RAD54B